MNSRLQWHTANLNKAILIDDNIPDDLPAESQIGKSLLMQPRGPALEHPAADLLNNYATNGCPVDCGPAWSMQQLLLLLKRGPHISGKNPEAAAFLREETEEKVRQGYARVVKWGSIKQHPPGQLKISPIDMIPHKSKRFRCILDLSFAL